LVKSIPAATLMPGWLVRSWAMPVGVPPELLFTSTSASALCSTAAPAFRPKIFCAPSDA
jgi:hypothetical protein